MGLTKRFLVVSLSVLLVLCSCPTAVNRSLTAATYAEEASPSPSPQESVPAPSPTPPASPAAKSSLELGELRTPFSQTILREDGLYQTEISLAPIFREDSDGHLQPTEELFTAQRSDSAITYGQGKDRITLSRSLSSTSLYLLEKGEARLSCELLGASSLAIAQESDRAVTYPNVFPSTDFRYLLSPNALKEEIVLQDPDAPPVSPSAFVGRG